MAAVLAAGCAPATTGDSSPRPDPDVIASDEIRALDDVVANAYDLVQRLRPQWLRSRGGSVLDAHNPKAYLDDAPYGELRALRQIPTLTIQEVRFYDAREATTLYGTGYPGGVVHVRTHP